MWDCTSKLRVVSRLTSRIDFSSTMSCVHRVRLDGIAKTMKCPQTTVISMSAGRKNLNSSTGMTVLLALGAPLDAFQIIQVLRLSSRVSMYLSREMVVGDKSDTRVRRDVTRLTA